MGSERSVARANFPQAMNSYLLLRDNKETGPFTLDEIREMKLKPFDLIWIVEKSAGWSYPAEIPEFATFAPALPEENLNTQNRIAGKWETSGIRSQEFGLIRKEPGKSIYVNLPAEKKIRQQPIITATPEYSSTFISNPDKADLHLSDEYYKQPSPAARFSGRVLWISTIALLFGAGILTGFFISDRRKFFTEEEKHPQVFQGFNPAVKRIKKENPVIVIPVIQPVLSLPMSGNKIFSEDSEIIPENKSTGRKTGKKGKFEDSKKDSIEHKTVSPVTPMSVADGLSQRHVSQIDIASQKIKAHPENYLSLVTGTYTSGLFGGISSFPVTLTNNSSVVMDLVVINVIYIQSNGKIFKSEDLSFTDLEPGETVSLKAPKSPRGIKIAARIHVVNIRQLDVNYTN